MVLDNKISKLSNFFDSHQKIYYSLKYGGIILCVICLILVIIFLVQTKGAKTWSSVNTWPVVITGSLGFIITMIYLLYSKIAKDNIKKLTKDTKKDIIEILKSSKI